MESQHNPMPGRTLNLIREIVVAIAFSCYWKGVKHLICLVNQILSFKCLQWMWWVLDGAARGGSREDKCVSCGREQDNTTPVYTHTWTHIYMVCVLFCVFFFFLWIPDCPSALHSGLVVMYDERISYLNPSVWCAVCTSTISIIDDDSMHRPFDTA